MGTAEPPRQRGMPQRLTRLVSIRCREMGTAEPTWDAIAGVNRGGFLFAVARWGQRNAELAPVQGWVAVVSIRCREMGTAEPPVKASAPRGVSAVSIRCREMGTAERRDLRPPARRVHRFYSLSRDGDSGTRPRRKQTMKTTLFLFAVARWGQRNPTPAGGPLTSTNAVRFRTRTKFGRTSGTRE